MVSGGQLYVRCYSIIGPGLWLVIVLEVGYDTVGRASPCAWHLVRGRNSLSVIVWRSSQYEPSRFLSAITSVLMIHSGGPGSGSIWARYFVSKRRTFVQCDPNTRGTVKDTSYNADSECLVRLSTKIIVITIDWKLNTIETVRERGLCTITDCIVLCNELSYMLRERRIAWYNGFSMS